MEQCPVCGKAAQGRMVCPVCGFDSSADREQYPTLVRAKNVMPSKRGLLLKDKKKLQQQVQTLNQELESLRAEVVALVEQVQYYKMQECTVRPEVHVEIENQESKNADQTTNSTVMIVESGECGYVDKCGDGGRSIKWYFYGSGLLQIEGIGVMQDYSVDQKAPWNKYSNQITQVEVKSGVTTVGLRAFEDFQKLRSAQLADTVQEIQSFVFCGCSALERIDLPDSIEKIERHAFSNCSALTQINIPDNVKEIGECAFEECTALKKVKLPSHLKTIEHGTFKNCISLGTIRIPAEVQYIAYEAFYGCSALWQVIFEGKPPRISITAFGMCRSLLDPRFWKVE